MAFPSKDPFEKFPEKIWLSSPTMHGEELVYITQAYRTNWMSTVGENINEVECIAAEQAGMQYASGFPAAPRPCIWRSGTRGKRCTAGLPSATGRWRGNGCSART